MNCCPACALPFPAAPLDVLAILGRDPAGLPTGTVARLLHRRRADVLVELRQAEAAGRVERLPAAGRAHAKRWRLRERPSEAPGAAREQRGRVGAGSGMPQAVPALPSRTALLLAAVALALAGLALLASAGAFVAVLRWRPQGA